MVFSSENKSVKRVVAFVPLPPPLAGPEIATQRMLDVLSLPTGCALKIVRANVRTANDKKGNFDAEGVFRAGLSLAHLFFTCLRFHPHKVYLLINPSKAGFLRDATAVFIAKLFFCKVIGHYHGSHFQYFYKNSSALYRFLIRKTLRKLDRLLVQAERLKNIFSGLSAPAKISVLDNGVSDDCLDRGKAALDLRKKEKREFVTFLFLGHISFTKGFYHLMAAYEKLLSESKNIRLLVAGDFILNPKTQIEFLEESDRQFFWDNYPKVHREMRDFAQNKPPCGVEYHGIVEGEKKYTLLERADVFILPSYTEGFPNVVLEAMAFGLALIVTPVGALPEILKEPENTLFVKSGNTNSLLEQMGRLVREPSLCIPMGMNNRERVTKQYRMQLTARQFEGFVFNQGWGPH